MANNDEFTKNLLAGASRIAPLLKRSFAAPTQRVGAAAQRVGTAVKRMATYPSPKDFTSLGRISTQFGEPTRVQKFHTGVDIANKEGTLIPGFRGGTVTEVGSQPGGYGNYVKIKDPSGYTERYSHLKQAYVKVGQAVGRGDIIGAMGKTGNVYSPSGGDPSHLHYEIVDAYNRYVNPSWYLGVSA